MRTHSTHPLGLVTAPGLAALAGALLFSVLPVPAQASQVPSPAITGSAKPFSGSYTAANLFAPGRNEFATAGQGACSAPLTTVTNNGTWVELDFGATVSFDRFIVATRANTVDVVGTNVLYVGDNPVHSLNDTVFTWSSAGQNGSAPIRDLGATVSGRYVRWEVLSAPGSSKNLGGRHIWFLRKPDNMNVLPAPTVIAGTPSFYGANYAPAHLADGGCGNDASAEEYAMRSSDSPSGFNVDFDFGEPTQISGFDFLQREVDFFPQLSFVFANDTNFTTVLASNTWTNNSANYNLWTSGTFAAVTARYVRLQGTGYTGGNPGGREVIFYTPTGQMPSATQNPQGGSFYVDDLVSLTVVARGDPPLFYQWREDSLPLAGATNSTLTFPSLQASNTGSYTVVISNMSST